MRSVPTLNFSSISQISPDCPLMQEDYTESYASNLTGNDDNPILVSFWRIPIEDVQFLYENLSSPTAFRAANSPFPEAGNVFVYAPRNVRWWYMSVM